MLYQNEALKPSNNYSSIDRDKNPPQKTYTVKYIGVVEGSMGILSRKMRMPKYTEASVYEKRNDYNFSNEANDHYMNYYESDVMQERYPLSKHTKEPNLKLVISQNRNIVIDKPLLASKRNTQTTHNDNSINVTQNQIQDDMTSNKSPQNNNDITESDEGTHTPDIQFRPVQQDAINENTEYGDDAVSPRISAEIHLNNQYQTNPSYPTHLSHNSMQHYSNFTNNSERATGFPMPDKYNSYYVNQYSIPKSFSCGRREDKEERKKKTEK